MVLNSQALPVLSMQECTGDSHARALALLAVLIAHADTRSAVAESGVVRPLVALMAGERRS